MIEIIFTYAMYIKITCSLCYTSYIYVLSWVVNHLSLLGLLYFLAGGFLGVEIIKLIPPLLPVLPVETLFCFL